MLALLVIVGFLSKATATCDIIEKYQKKGSQETSYNISELAIAAYEGNATILHDLIEKGCDINNMDMVVEVHIPQTDETVTVWNNSVLSYAALYGHLDVVKLLLEYEELKMDPVDSEGNTPLMLAASWGETEIVELLHKNGSDVNHRNNKGYTALHSAARFGYYETVLLLIDLGADLNVKSTTKYGETPVMLA